MSKNSFEPKDIKNYLFFHYIILGGTINRIFGFPVNKVKELSKSLENIINHKIKDINKDFKLILRKLSNYWNTIKFKKEFYDLEINFNNIFKYLNNNNEIDEEAKKEFKKVISIINIICAETSFRHLLAHKEKIEVNFNKVSKENKEIEEFLNKTIKIENITLAHKYFYFISNFVNNKIINELVQMFDHSFRLYGDKCNDIRMSYYLFNYEISWDETNPICQNFKNLLIDKIKDFNEKFNKKNKNNDKQEYKSSLKIISNLIFKILRFHCHKYNEEKSGDYVLILKNSSEYDESNTIDNRIQAMKLNQRRYKNLCPNTIYFVKKINKQELKEGKKNWIVEKNTTIKNVWNFYNHKEYDLFNYDDFLTFIENEIIKIQEYKKETKEDLEGYKKDKYLENQEKKLTEKQTENLLKRLEGTRKKYNDDFIWFLKLSKKFIENKEINNNPENKESKNIIKLKKILHKSCISLLNNFQTKVIDDFKENVRNLLKKINEKYNKKLILDIENKLKNLKNKEDAFLLYEQIISLSKKYFNIKNIDRNFLLDKKEYNILINKSLEKGTLKEKIRLFYYFKNSNKKPINILIKNNIKVIIKNFISDKSNINNEQLFREIYQEIYNIEKSIEINYKKHYYTSPFLNNNFIDTNISISKNKTYKLLFLNPYLLKKAKELKKDNPLEFVKQFIEEYNKELKKIFDEEINGNINKIDIEQRNKLFHFGVNKGREEEIIDEIIKKINIK